MTRTMAIYMRLMIMMVVIIQDSGGRELRPSEHGLEYQSASQTREGSPPEMKAFFLPSTTAAKNTTSSSPPSMELPRAMNSNDTSWWTSVTGGGGRDHVRHVLLVATLVCGVTGLGLLVASALIYFVRHKNQSSSSSTKNTSITVDVGRK